MAYPAIENFFQPALDGGAMSIGHVHLRAFAHATEELERVMKALAFASGKDEVEKSNSRGHFGNPIVIVEVGLTRSKDIKGFFKRLNDAGIAGSLAGEVEQRMDDDSVLHFRLDKQMAYLGRLELAEGKDVIDCSMKVRAYPARRDVAIAAVRKFLNDFPDG
jgi:RNA binding exosome subunit